MKNGFKKQFEKNGFLVVRNVLDFDFDLKPVLNDMEFIMNRLVHRFVSLKQRKNDDKRKKDLCNLNDLNLIIIPYTIKKKNISRYIFEKCKNFGYRKNSNLFKWSYKDIYHRHSDQLNLIKLADTPLL